MFYSLIINRKFLRKIETYLQNWGYTNYHYIYINDYLINLEVYMYDKLTKHENCLRRFSSELKVVQ